MRSHAVWQGRRCDVMWFAALSGMSGRMRHPTEAAMTVTRCTAGGVALGLGVGGLR